MYYCNFVNPPPVSQGEGPFPESIVDDRDAEPISALVARMLRGELPPRDRELMFDTDDENADPDDFPSNVLDPTEFDFPSGIPSADPSPAPEATKEDPKPETDKPKTDQGNQGNQVKA